jgi:hypothetical protein
MFLSLCVVKRSKLPQAGEQVLMFNILKIEPVKDISLENPQQHTKYFQR